MSLRLVLTIGITNLHELTKSLVMQKSPSSKPLYHLESCVTKCEVRKHRKLEHHAADDAARTNGSESLKSPVHIHHKPSSKMALIASVNTTYSNFAYVVVFWLNWFLALPWMVWTPSDTYHRYLWRT